MLRFGGRGLVGSTVIVLPSTSAEGNGIEINARNKSKKGEKNGRLNSVSGHKI